MAGAKPYMTTNALVASIQRRAAIPISQNTFLYSDIVAFVNEELLLNAVPTLIQEHEEYLTFKAPIVPLVDGISRYSIPNRALGMALRDLLYSDESGNFFKMTRIAPEDKAYFQRNVGSNQAVGMYYLEGNEIVITPQVVSGATGSLNFIIFLRPNQLVRDNRAAVIEAFQKTITLANNTISDGDTITITTNNQTPAPSIYTFTAITGGSPTSGQFLVGVDVNTTTSNLVTAISSAQIEDVFISSAMNSITLNYNTISDTFVASNENSFLIDNNYTYIVFDQLPSTYTDPDTDVTSTLYTQNCKVDFLQTDPGHRTYTYDIKLKAINGNIGTFKTSDLKTWLNNSSGGEMLFYNIQIGDYICLANECIIPQIPPELHNALAERAASRVLMALGDQQGLQNSQMKIAEMDKKQDTLIGSRVEGSVNKVFNSSSLLRIGKRSTRRRM